MDEVLLPVAADPTIALSVTFRTGSQDDPPGKEGLAYLTAAMLAEASTKTRSYEEILAALYPLATGYAASVDREQTALTGRVHRDAIDEFLALYVAALTEPAFEADDFARLRDDAVNYVSTTLRYASDEELAKAVLYAEVFAGTAYAHPSEGTVAGLESITLDDVRAFYTDRFTQANATVGVAGGFAPDLADSVRAAVARLPAGSRVAPPAVEAAAAPRNRVVLVDKPGADASISFGFPLAVHRGETDFYALWVANSWLGEHRNSASHLYQVIREQRGLNYGDYSYIECFPDGGSLQMPPVNVARRRQLFEIWIRTVPVAQAPFALKAAVRELERLCADGMDAATFELTRQFLKNYSAHFAPAAAARLGYAIDDRFYDELVPGLATEGHLARFDRMLDELTLDDVNGAIARHLQGRALTIAVVADDAPALAERLTGGRPTPVEYESAMSDEILAEDEIVAAYPVRIEPEATRIVPLEATFAR